MDELNEAQVIELLADLKRLQIELSDSLKDSEAAARPVDLDEAIGRVSRNDAIQQQKMAQAGRANVNRRLAQIAAALKAVEEEEYGLCRRCEDPVGYKRLKARPESPLCVDCQTIVERRRR